MKLEDAGPEIANIVRMAMANAEAKLRQSEAIHNPTMTLLEWAEKTARFHVHSVYHYGDYESCKDECCIEARAILAREKKP